MRSWPTVVLLTFLTSSLAAQPAPPPKVQWFPAAAAIGAPPWQTLVDRATLSIARRQHAVGANAESTAQDRDAVYCVLRGAAQLTAGGETRTVGPGDCVFVAAATAHRFHDVATDLDVVVFHSAARPSTGGMVEGPVPTEQTAYPETSPRGATRIFYWFGPDSAGQVAIDHGQPLWNARHEQFLAKASGTRWRCGQNFWTTLDTNMPLELGGVAVPVGSYYVVLQHSESGLELVLLDPAVVRARRLDAYEAAKTTGGIVVPLARGKAEQLQTRLSFALQVDRAQRDRGRLSLSFGPHRLHCEVVMQPAR